MDVWSYISSFFHKLFTRVVFLVIGCGMLPSLCLTGVFLYFMEANMIEADRVRMISQAQMLNSDLVTEGFLAGRESESIRTEIETLSNSFSGRIMVMDEGLTILSDTYGMYEGRTLIWNQALLSLSDSTDSYYDRINHYLIMTLPIKSYDEEDAIQGVLLITMATEDIVRTMDFMISLAIVANLTVFVLLLAVAFLVSGHMTKPLRRIAIGMQNITLGIRQDPLDVKEFAEYEAISEGFNAYREEMKVLDEGRSEFVSNVSHELKTPLTSMKVLADSINSMGKDAPLEMYAEFMADITGEIDHENAIIDELLSLVRLEKAKDEPHISQVNMNEFLEVLLKRLRPIAEKRNIELVLESFRPVTAEIDEVQLSLALMNLIENAIKYNNDGGWVHVSLNADHQYCFIRVEDNGLGIPKESVDRIFDRFYRADESHSRQIAGTGLGLAIAHDAIVLHHGEIQVHSMEGDGTTFDVRIPLRYIKETETF